MVPKNKKEFTTAGIGVYSINDRTFLYGLSKTNRITNLSLQVSSDELNFYGGASPHLFVSGKKELNYSYIKNLHISPHSEQFLLTAKTQKPTVTNLSIFSSRDLINWNQVASLKSITEHAIIIPNYTYQGKYAMYFGEDTIKVAYSSDLQTWDIQPNSLLTPRHDFFDYGALSVGSVSISKEGIVVIYAIRYGQRRDTRFGLGVALFDLQNPSKLMWRSPISFFDQPDHFSYKMVELIGITDFANTYVSYWQVENEGVSAIFHQKHIQKHADNLASAHTKLKLKKLPQNPILNPITSHPWESKAVFNPAALYDEGKVHLLYRAVGDSDGSVLGYASSRDGTTIDERLDEPVYAPSQPFEKSGNSGLSPQLAYFSGGIYGGCEDPRITKIGDKVYMTYVAFNGWQPPRVALTSIDYTDFQNKDWKWTTPVLISPPGVVDKNACILPEKIDGKYVVFHRIFPNILIDYVDSLDFDGTSYLKGEFFIGPRSSGWDSRKVGAGPPPLKTKDGWLLIYHAVGNHESNRYKIGAMLLDLKDPTKVLYRSKHPILEPSEWYENNGLKYGVAYPCGAIILNDKLIVYYGGSDMVTCAATADLDEFLTHLKTDESPHLQSVSFKPMTLEAPYASSTM